MKSKNVKLPMELVESLERRIQNTKKSPGEVLLEIYKEYQLLEGLAAAITEQRKDLEHATVYDKIMRYIADGDGKINQLQKSVDELNKMLDGLKLYLEKVRIPSEMLKNRG